MRAEDESMAESKGIEQTLQHPVFIRGQNRPFGELPRADARSRADELKAATGGGPTMRVAPVCWCCQRAANCARFGCCGTSRAALSGLRPTYWAARGRAISLTS